MDRMIGDMGECTDPEFRKKILTTTATEKKKKLEKNP